MSGWACNRHPSGRWTHGNSAGGATEGRDTSLVLSHLHVIAMLLRLALLAAGLVACAEAKACEGENLPKDAPLRSACSHCAIFSLASRLRDAGPALVSGLPVTSALHSNHFLCS